ncbi:MAG: C4-dicarboxylate ABC transporter permease [Lachnospiraceae bacterium]|nr:C4-dicarboxylate ABC transporter permease [Lachnospiraceae bacterium]
MCTSVLNLLTLSNLAAIHAGLFAGIIIGALPGLSATMGVALLMPLTFGMDTVTAIVLLLGVYCGGIYGGSITAILIKTPGTAASAATSLDGYPLAQEGKAGLALDVALKASVAGGIVSALVLLLVAEKISTFALHFAAPEYFSLALFGLTIIASIGGENQLKGMIAGMMGLLIACVGMDPINGSNRFIFGITELLGGIGVIPAMVGLFAVTEIMNKAKTIQKEKDTVLAFSNERISWRELLKSWPNLLRSSLIGTFIGAIPGTGAATASFLAYNEARRTSKKKELFGKGSTEGVAASEAANNGVTGATLIPLLTLGIPGDTVTAILLGAFMMKGITPGPSLIESRPEIVYTIMVSMILINLFMLVQGRFFVRVFANVTKIPTALLLPLLITLCVIGSYSCGNSVFDVKLAILFGLIGYVMMKLEIPLTPMVIAIVLGGIAESNLRRGVAMASGDYTIFFRRPISLFFILLAVFSLCFPTIRQLMQHRKNQRKTI